MFNFVNTDTVIVDKLFVDLNNDGGVDSVFILDKYLDGEVKDYASHIKIKLSNGYEFLYEGRNEWKPLNIALSKYKVSEFIGYKKIKGYFIYS